jgi:cell wall-associated NlpC family hydrolase
MIAQPAHKIRGFALTLAVLSMLSGCGSQVVYDRSPQRTSQPDLKGPVVSIGERAAQIARQQVGIRYRYGGASRDGFDCSGLVQYAYRQAGKSIARTTAQQWSSTSPVTGDELRVGDLLFFTISGKMSHVGLYIGDDKFVHAPSSGRTVTVNSLASPFYARAYIRAGRPK